MAFAIHHSSLHDTKQTRAHFCVIGRRKKEVAWSTTKSGTGNYFHRRARKIATTALDEKTFLEFARESKNFLFRARCLRKRTGAASVAVLLMNHFIIAERPRVNLATEAVAVSFPLLLGILCTLLFFLSGISSQSNELVLSSRLFMNIKFASH